MDDGQNDEVDSDVEGDDKRRSRPQTQRSPPSHIHSESDDSHLQTSVKRSTPVTCPPLTPMPGLDDPAMINVSSVTSKTNIDSDFKISIPKDMIADLPIKPCSVAITRSDMEAHKAISPERSQERSLAKPAKSATKSPSKSLAKSSSKSLAKTSTPEQPERRLIDYYGSGPSTSTGQRSAFGRIWKKTVHGSLVSSDSPAQKSGKANVIESDSEEDISLATRITKRKSHPHKKRLVSDPKESDGEDNIEAEESVEIESAVDTEVVIEKPTKSRIVIPTNSAGKKSYVPYFDVADDDFFDPLSQAPIGFIRTLEQLKKYCPKVNPDDKDCKLYKCGLCGLIVNEHIMHHLAQAHHCGNFHKCAYCAVLNYSVQALRLHVKTAHPKKEQDVNFIQDFVPPGVVVDCVIMESRNYKAENSNNVKQFFMAAPECRMYSKPAQTVETLA